MMSEKKSFFFSDKLRRLPRQRNKRPFPLLTAMFAVVFLYVLGITRHHHPENSSTFPVLPSYPNFQLLHVQLFSLLKYILVAGQNIPCISFDVKSQVHLQSLQFQHLGRSAFECSQVLLVEPLVVHRSEQLLKLYPSFSLSFKCPKHHQPQITQAVSW